jgi:nitrite reductase/ring-hydroxylating ferredoxin subunit
MPEGQWKDIGSIEELKRTTLQEIQCGKTRIALTYNNGKFSAISGVCNHVGGPLGKGRLDGEYVVCPWHYWKFHHKTGQGEAGYEQDQVPTYATKIQNGRLYIDLSSATKRKRQPHAPHPLARPIVRQPGPVCVVGIATTAMTVEHPRYSTSDALLDVALEHAKTSLGLETQSIKLRELNFRACEGFYSKAAQACTWPYSITQMDSTDQLDRVYEAIVHWADVILVSTPIR